MATDSPHGGISQRRVLKGGLIVAAGLAASQIAGFARQAAVGYLMGTGADADAFSAAMAPMELWWNVLALAVIFGFVPKLAEIGASGGYSYLDILRPVARLAFGSSVVFLVFAKPIVGLFAPGLEPESGELAAGLLRVIGLAPAAVGCSFVYSALLYSRRHFALPSFHNAVVNVWTIVGALAFHARFGVYGFAAGYVLGAWFHFGVGYLYSKRVLAKRPEKAPRADRKLDLWTLLSGPGPILGQALALELNAAVSRAYASTFGAGMTAAFEYGFKLFRVPMALLVVPLSQSLLPEISQLGDDPAERRSAIAAIKRAAAGTAMISAAAAVFLAVFRDPIVEILFQRGAFGQASTQAVAAVLLGYMPVILGRSVLELLSRALFGLSVYRIPVIGAVVALVLNAGVCALLPAAHPAMIGLGATVGFLVGAYLIVSHVRQMEGRQP